MLFLSKLIPVFLFPLGFSILLAAGALVSGVRRATRLLIGASVFVLWVASTPVVTNWLYADLEGVFAPVPISQLPRAEVAVVLGGIVGQPLPPRIEPDMGDPVDRILEAWRIFRADKVATIVVSGGNLGWESAIAPEASLIRDFLIELGVPRDAIVLEAESQNTHENAVNTAALFRQRGWDSALLITSAAHMPRALAAFQKAGIRAVPVPTDIQARYPLAESVLDFLPSAEALGRTTSILKEWLGLAYYRWRGWA